MCPPDSKIKYSLFSNIYVLMFTYYTVCYSIGIFYAVVRQISMLFIDNKDSVLCTSTTRPDCVAQHCVKTRRSETALGQEALQQDQTERNSARTRSSPTRPDRARQKHSKTRASPTALRQDRSAWDTATDVKRVGTRSDRSVAESTCSAQHAGHRPDP